MKTSSVNGKHVLFADDELHYIQALIEVTRAEGCIVTTCRDASAAITQVCESHIDCLIIDIMMDPGPLLPDADPQFAGITAINQILKKKPDQSIICHSVVSDQRIINDLKKRKVLFLRKAETSLEKAWQTIEAKITGVYHGR